MEDADNAKSLYEMELHEIIDFGTYVVMRVPGGWIYYSHHGNVFVPYSDEFRYK